MMSIAFLASTGVLLAACLFPAASDDRPDPPVQDETLRTQHNEGQTSPQWTPPGPRQVRPPLPPALLNRNGFQSVQVNVDEDGNNIVDDAANEPSIAVDPLDSSRIAIGWRQFDTIRSNFRQAGWGFTQDGGAMWTFPGVLEENVFRSDPVLDFDAQGTFYYYSLKIDFCCDMYISQDGGQTWPVDNPAAGGDKAWFTIDRTAGIGQGHIYTTWNSSFDCIRQGRDFTRSVDGGLTFSTPVTLPGRPFWGTLTVGPGGTLYISSANMNVIRSFDAQDPDVEPTFEIAGVVNLGGRVRSRTGPNPGGLLGQVWIAADHSDGPSRGDVYVLSSVEDRTNTTDVMIARSRNMGETWEDPVRVNDTGPNDGSWQWFGTMSVAPSSRIDVIWNDTRNTGQDNLSEVFYSFSTDGAQTWSPNVAITPVFDSHIGWPRQSKIGDYYDMISDEGGGHLAYSATFNGEQDVYYVYIAPDCNENGIHDGDDIAQGNSEDENGNGIPDECEGGCVRDPEWQCDGDVDGDGQVNPVDSGLVQASFGSANEQDLCNYDIDCDGQINPVDSGIVQSLFGTCEAPRQVCP